MKRFLISTTAVALALAIGGIAKADDRNGHRFNHGRFDRERDAIRCFDHWRFDFDWHDCWRFRPWRFDYHRDDFRYFDRKSRQFDLERDDLRYFDPSWFVLSRKGQESVVVGGSGGFERILKTTVSEIDGGKVRRGFEADKNAPVSFGGVEATPRQRSAR